jgi:hypothetical protein
MNTPTLLLLEAADADPAPSCCFCQSPITRAGRLGLVEPAGYRPVCPSCASRKAPRLAAVLELIAAAERFGRIGRHAGFPPLTSLLELSRAAENYAQSEGSLPKAG